jgi:hypothetical protein
MGREKNCNKRCDWKKKNEKIENRERKVDEKEGEKERKRTGRNGKLRR